MRRRDCLIALSALAALPVTSLGQPRDGNVHRLGFLGTALASGYVRELDWIREGLRKLGYVEGRNLLIEYRWAEGAPERLRQHAEELARLKVDAILTHSTFGALAAARATSTIPIVQADGADPVGAGLAKSLARPGGNVTGSFSFIPEEIGKRLELLMEAKPGIRRLAYLASSVDPVIGVKRKALQAAAATMKVEMREFAVRAAADLPEVFNEMGRWNADAVLVNNESVLNPHAGAIAALAALKHLPSVGYASFADAGGLLAYGANRAALYGRAGYFLDRIFRGEQPGDIPFERAARFDVFVNQRTAKGLGLAVPQSLLLRADRVIN